MSKSTGSHKAFTGRPKSTARGCYNVTFMQDVSKHIPGGLLWKANPDVGGVLAAIHAEAHVLKSLAQDAGVLLIIAHQVQHCLIPLVLQHHVSKFRCELLVGLRWGWEPLLGWQPAVNYNSGTCCCVSVVSGRRRNTSTWHTRKIEMPGQL